MRLALLFSLVSVGAWAGPRPVSSDRFLLKVLDQTVSFQDFQFQARNLKALDCVYDDALVIQYFEKSFTKDWDGFLKGFPKEDAEIVRYLHQHADLLKKIRLFFKMLRYSDDQKIAISPDLSRIIRKGAKENGCDGEVLYKETLKTNFLGLLRVELYLRSRYGGQLKGSVKFSTIRPSIDLFVESLDKQFGHEYYW